MAKFLIEEQVIINYEVEAKDDYEAKSCCISKGQRALAYWLIP